MVTQQMSVERLFSGVEKLCWIWHGKEYLEYFDFSVFSLKFGLLIESYLANTVVEWRILFWGMLWREYQKKAMKMRERVPKTPLLTAQKTWMV